MRDGPDCTDFERPAMKTTIASKLRSTALCVTLVAGLSLTTGCGALMGMLAAMQEDPSLELAIDRVDAIAKTTEWGERFLSKTRVGSSTWPSDLYDINDQAAGIRAQILRRGPHNRVAERLGVISAKTYKITHSEIFKHFMGAQIDKIGEGEGPYESVLNAFATIYGEAGAPIMEGLAAVDTATTELEAAQAALAAAEAELETEEEREDVEDDTIAALEARVDEADDSVDAKEEDLENAETSVIESIEAVAGSTIDSSLNDAAWDVLQVVNFLSYAYEANVKAAGMVLIQVPRAIPGIGSELQDMGIRLVFESVQDMAEDALGGLSLAVTINGDGLALELTGAPAGLNVTDVKRILMTKLTETMNKGLELPANIGSIATKSGSRMRLLAAMVNSLEDSTGRSISPLSMDAPAADVPFEPLTLEFPDAVPEGCVAADGLRSLAQTTNPNVDVHKAVLRVPPQHICWLEDGEECTPESCLQLPALTSLMRLYEGPYGLRLAILNEKEIRGPFVDHLARVLDALAERDGKPKVSALIDGLTFEQFREAHANGFTELDSAVVGDFLDGFAYSLKLWALQFAVPNTLEKAEQALEELASPQLSSDARAAQAKERAKAVRQREHDRLRAELQRRLLELQEAAERARRAAEVVRAARVQEPLVETAMEEPEYEEKTAAPLDEEPFAARCRAGAATRTLGTTPLKATAADIYCLITEAKANPKVVPKSELKRLTTLFTSLQETVIELALEELRWALAAPTGASALLDEIGGVPLVSKTWKKRMISKVTSVCTGHLTTLAKSDHEDIILADQWLSECFKRDGGKRRTWYRKIATKLKTAIIWRDRLEAERAAKAAALAKQPSTTEPAEAAPAPEPTPESPETN
jgi:hypothetical protein